MLGTPESERQNIRHRLDISLQREPGQMEPSPENQQAIIENGMLWHQLTVEKRQNPADDMLSRLTQVTVDRGDGVETGLDDLEITGFATLLGGAGAETVTKLVGNAVVLFWKHPDQWRKILDDHSKIPRVDEILRYLPPSQYQGRYCVQERELEGGTVPAGFPVLLITGRQRTIHTRSNEPTSSTSSATRASRSASATACTAASVPRSARLESRIAIEGSPPGGASSKSTKLGFAGCACRASRATRTCRCGRFALDGRTHVRIAFLVLPQCLLGSSRV